MKRKIIMELWVAMYRGQQWTLGTGGIGGNWPNNNTMDKIIVEILFQKCTRILVEQLDQHIDRWPGAAMETASDAHRLLAHGLAVGKNGQQWDQKQQNGKQWGQLHFYFL
jgi:hypothetical protein